MARSRQDRALKAVENLPDIGHDPLFDIELLQTPQKRRRDATDGPTAQENRSKRLCLSLKNKKKILVIVSN